MEMRQYFEMNKENTTYQNLWNAAKSHAQREIYSLQQIYFKKAKKRKAEKLMSLVSFQEVRNSPIQEVRKRTIKSKETTRKET